MEPMPLAPSWQPLLDGDSRARALAAVDAVADDVDRLSTAPPSTGSAAVDELIRASVANGDAGVALFFAYLDLHRPGAGHDDRALVHLERAIDQTARSSRLADLYSGFCGVAWTIEHLQGRLLDPDPDEDPNDEIDRVLVEHLGQTPWRRDYDLTSGLVGYAVYALSRLPRPAAAEALERIVARLAETASAHADGFTWHTPPELLRGEARDYFPGGNENLGVAHGVPGVIAVLAQIGRAGIAAERAGELLEGAVSWLLAQELGDESPSRFPYAVGPEVVPRFTRAAWCYGDPGIAATLLVAARAAGRADWEREAVRIAHGAAHRPADTAGVRDACLCHGAAGLGHVFNRMWQATGDPVLRDAAVAWLEDALGRRTQGGVGGFLNWGVGSDDEMAWRTDPSFLTGGAGVALALLAAASEIEPAWDSLLLLSPSR